MFQANKPPQQSNLSTARLYLPEGLNLETSEGALIITRQWFSYKLIGFAIVALIWNAFLLLFAYNVSIWIYFCLPHGWIGIWLAYYVLTGIFNTTIITVTASRITIEHHPIPYPGNKQLETSILRQVYAKQKTNRNSHTYDVRMITTEGRDKPLLTGLDKPEQALYLKEQIEQFLGIENKPITGELNNLIPQAQRTQWDSWQRFAQNNNFTMKAYGVHGIYHGYEFSLLPQRNLPLEPIQTHLRLAIPSQVSNTISSNIAELEQSFTKEAIINQFNLTQAKFSLKGKVYAKKGGQEIFYEQQGFETNVGYLQYVLDVLFDLMGTYPQIVALGGEAVAILQPIATEKEYFLLSYLQLSQEKDHPLRAVAIQLLKDISQNTVHLHRQMGQLLCKHCLVHCTAHSVSIPGMETLTYYGCRACHQSRDFYPVDSVIALLGDQIVAESAQQKRTLRVNWLAHRTVFDFDTVEIIQATDEEVERFAVQVGNDMDTSRKLK